MKILTIAVTFAAFLSAPLYGQTVLQYGFDDVAGSVTVPVNDDSGSGNHGTDLLFGGSAPTYSADIPVNKRNCSGIGSLDFTGTPAGISTADSAGVGSGQGILTAEEVSAAGGLTMEVWVKNVSTTSNPSAALNMAGMYVLGVNSAGYLGFFHGDNSNDTAWTVDADTAEWTHLAVVMVTTDALTYEITAYINGAAIYTDFHTFPWFLTRATSVGNHQYVNWADIEGLVYEPRISLGALDPSQFTFVISGASNPYPPNGATGVVPSVVLTWQSGVNPDNPSEPDPRITDHLVYFSNGANNPNLILVDSIPAGNPTEFDPDGDLKQDATYYWRVDEKLDDQSVITGTVWSFSVKTPETNCLYLQMGDLNADCSVGIDDLQLMVAQWLDDDGCADYACGDLDENNMVDFADLAILAECWNKEVTVLINEFLTSNHSGGIVDEDGQSSDWIELRNFNSYAINLQGWYLTDNPNNLDKWKFPDVTIQPGEYLIVFASGKDRAVSGSELHTNFTLDLSGEYLALVGADGETVVHDYAPKFPSQYEDVSFGMALRQGDRYVSNNYFLTPTPRGSNSSPYPNVGSSISNVEHNPAQPGDNDDLIVTAAITETQKPISSVQLHYRVMYNSEISLEMFDDGLHGDANSVDGIYGAIIPATVTGPGEMLRYYITAADSASGQSRAPLPLDLSGQNQSPQYFGTVIVDSGITTQLPVLHWFVENPSAAVTDTGTRASVYYDGEFYDNIFVRRRGASTASWPKHKFKLDFNKGYFFRYSDSAPPVDEINLQSHWLEVSIGGRRDYPSSYLRETASLQFQRDAGVQASNSFHIQLQQNGSFYGLYSFVEQVDETFLQRHGFEIENAVMYKAVSSGSTRSNLGPNPDPSVYQEIIPGNGSAFSQLQALTAGINEGNADRAVYVYDNINLSQVINELATQTVLNNPDRLVKNYYIYLDPVTGQWNRFPWDMEMGFGVDTTFSCCEFLTNENFNSPLYGDNNHVQGIGMPNTMHHLNDAIFDIDSTRQMYVRRVRTLIDEYLADGTDYFENLVNVLKTKIEAEADADNLIWGAGDIDGGVDSILLTWLPTRRTQLFETYGPFGSGLIPESQPLNPVMSFGEIIFNPSSGNQNQEYVEIVNQNGFAVDISGWQISGGIELLFQPGTVVPSQSSLYISPDVRAFRAREISPKGNEGRFAQDNYKGHLSNWGETINLFDNNGNLVASKAYQGNPSAAQQYLRVTEVMYHPQGGGSFNEEEYEYIELKNIGTAPLLLDGVKITDGISYEFAPGSGLFLPSGQMIVIIKNRDAFSERYDTGNIDIAPGQYTKSLSNGGETIKIEDDTNSTIIEFRYEDFWWPLTDGPGYSLDILDAGNSNLDSWNISESWQVSSVINGTPGKEDFGI